jgi:hypothetical protein
MHSAKKNKKHPVLYSILGIVVLIILGIVFFVPINNGIRSATGNDTPTDKVIKDQLVKKVKAGKTGSPEEDAKIDKSAAALDKTKMSKIMAAANDKAQAAKLIQESSNLSQPASEKAADEIFSNSKFDSIRSAMSDGDWYKVYSQYQDLSGNGTLSQLKQSVGQ